MSPTPRTLHRPARAKRSADLRPTIALAITLAVALAYAAPIPAAAAPAGVESSMGGPGGPVLAYVDEVLPGEGRPPSPGPTDPGGLS